MISRRRIPFVVVSATLLIAAALVFRTPSPSTTVSPSPTASSAPSTGAPSATASATGSPTASPTPAASASTARPGIIVTAAGTIPPDFTYVLVQNTGSERALLIDLPVKRSREVVRFDRPEAARRSVVLSASADGQTLAILERSDATLLLHVVRPATGELRTLPQQDGVDGPNISPDGVNIAVAWTSSDPVLNGLWLLPPSGAVGTRIIGEAFGLPGSPPKPRAWSIDGRWIAAFGVGASANQILVVDTRAGSTTYAPASGLSGGDGRVLAGIDAVWRGSEVLVWSSRTASSGPPIMTSYDTQTRAAATVFTAGPDQSILDAAPRPNSRQVAILVSPFSNLTPTTPRTILLVEPGVAPRSLRDIAFVQRIWWSPDGAHLYVRTGGDESVGRITDVFGTWGSMQFCLRGGEPPACV